MNKKKNTHATGLNLVLGGFTSIIIASLFIFALRANKQAVSAPTNATKTPFSPQHDPTATQPPTLPPALSPQALPTLSEITPYTLPEGINPLTGLPPDAPELLEHRPVASKIALYPRYIRPEAGLNFADVVFEYYIESGLTRFIAVYYGKTAPRIGPVRSGRFFDAHVARMYQSYLVFKYADKRVYDYLKTSDIQDFLIVPGNSACPPFLIGKEERDTYNNIFLNGSKFSECLEKQGKDDSPPDFQTSYFDSEQPAISAPATGIFTRYSLDDYHYWQYNLYTHRYDRYQESNGLRNGNSPGYAPLTDILDGQQVAADNVIFLFVPHTFENQFQEEDEVYHIDLIGLGEAYLARDGHMFPAYWRRIATDQPLLITDRSGNPLPLKPGNTFYEVLGKSSKFTRQEEQWFFLFETP